MTLQDFKDQIADKYGYQNWSELRFSELLTTEEVEEYADEAAELYAKEREKEGYRMGWENRGLPEFILPTLKPYNDEYPMGGYAPGSYMCKCATCGCEFFGDKRAVQCLPCASGLSSAAVKSTSK